EGKRRVPYPAMGITAFLTMDFTPFFVLITNPSLYKQKTVLQSLKTELSRNHRETKWSGAQI
ncbi:MAG: hypothetical protein OXI24_19255, partial [Candidatus Poribacteria bacterium]|nr:hypothetical protein [Candidatus Poribacteria bacterium]